LAVSYKVFIFVLVDYITMDKIKKSLIKEFVKIKLSTDPKWTQQALRRIYEFQTQEEQRAQDTRYHNGVGFTGTDGRILSSLAKQLQRYGRLSEKQMGILFKKMPKYWQQVVKISDKEKLNSLIQQ
jgi:hypothetical protein